MICRTNVGGGGAGSPDLPIGSRINVTSNEGATITIIRGSESQSSVVPASGTITFTVHQSGTWTIKANKTGKTELTKTVSILADDTDYNNTMFWRTYLYKDGTISTLMGDFTLVKPIASVATLTKNATNVRLYNEYVRDAHFGSSKIFTANSIDMSIYSTLVFVFSSISCTGSAITPQETSQYGVTSGNSTSYPWLASNTISPIVNETNKSILIDISEIDSGYPAICIEPATSSGTRTITSYLTEIYLE